MQKLRKAMEDYENDKWRLIAAKVGSGFSPAACQEKAEELEVQEEFEEAMSEDSTPSVGPSTRPYGTIRSTSEPQSSISAPTIQHSSTMGSSAVSYPATSAPTQHYGRMS